MKVSLILLLFLTAVMVDQSEGGIRRWVGRAVRWVKSNCRVGLGSVSCSGRRRRDVPGIPVVTNFGKDAREDDKEVFTCQSLDLVNVTKLPKRAVDEVFDDIDDDDDSQLNAVEFAQFQETVQIFEDCITEKNKTPRKTQGHQYVVSYLPEN